MKGKEKTLPETNEIATPCEEAAKKPGKLFIVLSYVIALAGLIAALFVPLFYGEMPVKYLLAAVSSITELFGMTIPSSAYGSFFIDSAIGIEYGVIITAIFLSAAIALVLLIPVIAGKAAKGTNLRCAFAAEFIAFLFVSSLLCLELFYYVGGWSDYSFIIAFGVLVLVMAAQSIKYKGWLGTMKFVAFILALLTLFSLFDVATIIPAIQSPLNSLNKIGTTEPTLFNAVYSLKGILDGSLTPHGNTVGFVSELIYLIIPVLVCISVLIDLFWLVCGNKTRKNGEPHTHKGWFVFSTVRYLVIILLIIAAIVLSSVLAGFEKISLYFYLTAVLVVLSFIIEIIRYCTAKSKLKAHESEQRDLFNHEKIVLKDETLAVEEEQPVEENVQTTIAGIPAAEETAPETVEETEEQPTQENGEQLTCFTAQPEENAVEEQTLDAEVEEQPVEEIAPVEEVVPEQPVATPVIVPAPAPVEEVKAEPVVTPAPVAEAPVVTATPFGETVQPTAQSEEEKVNIDPFIDKLTNVERAQFFDVFVNMNRGKFTFIPAYKINGDNSAFFPAVFVHINRIREICDESLIRKIYKEIGRN